MKTNPEPIVKGTVDMWCSEGMVLITSTGRLTTPFPKLRSGSNRKAINTLRRIDKWLMHNAALEADARGDEYNGQTFWHRFENMSQVSHADKDIANYYLFDQQP